MGEGANAQDVLSNGCCCAECSENKKVRSIGDIAVGTGLLGASVTGYVLSENDDLWQEAAPVFETWNNELAVIIISSIWVLICIICLFSKGDKCCKCCVKYNQIV